VLNSETIISVSVTVDDDEADESTAAAPISAPPAIICSFQPSGKMIRRPRPAALSAISSMFTRMEPRE